MVKITIKENGPYRVEGEDVTVVDWQGVAYHPKNPRAFSLCRCGASTTKPFCDGTHSRVGFMAAAAAVPESADQLAPAE